MKPSLLAVVCACACAPASAQTPERFRAIRASIEARLTSEKVPSLAIAVAQDGKVLWEDAVGWADVEQRVAATPDTLYSIASVTKPITATALMVLVERGKVALDHPANEYLRDAKLVACVGDASGATLERLCDHTSGLARHDFFADGGHAPLPIDERIRRYGRLVREPGETREYSNLGYMALARVIELQSGKRFARFVREEVFVPLGMSHSSLDVDARHRAGVATSYGADGVRRDLPERPDDCAGHGGAFASAHDLVRFGMFHLEQLPTSAKPILPRTAIERMRRRSSRGDDGSWSGVGWTIEERAFAAPAVMHTGQDLGSTACLVLIPEHRLCVVTLSNSATDLPWRVLQEVVAAFVPPREQTPGTPAESDARGTRAFDATDGWIGHWKGAIRTYEREIPVELWLDADGKIAAQLAGQAKVTAGGVRVEDGYLRGSIDGDLGTSDTKDVACRLHFKLKRRGESLNGSVTASSRPGQRFLQLSHWIEVQRAGD